MKTFLFSTEAELETDSDIALSRFRRESGPVKRYSVKCLNDCLSSDSTKGTTSYLDCLKTCDSEDGKEDNTDDNTEDNVSNNDNVDDGVDDGADGGDGDAIYY